MRGTMMTLRASGGMTQEICEEPVELETIQKKVGGHIELIPEWDSIPIRQVDGTFIVQRCIAYCNEEGKLDGLPNNISATTAWNECLYKKGIINNRDHLVGDVVVLYGDDEFMGSM